MGFPGEFPKGGDGGEGLFSSQMDYNPPVYQAAFIPQIAGIAVKAIEWLPIVLEILDATREVPPPPVPASAPPNEEHGCPELVRAIEGLTIEIAHGNEIHRVGYRSLVVTLAAISGNAANIQATMLNKFPSRQFQVGAAIDTQHHIRDGFDAIAQRMAQWIKIETDVSVGDVDLPELKYTDPALDADVEQTGVSIIDEIEEVEGEGA